MSFPSCSSHQQPTASHDPHSSTSSKSPTQSGQVPRNNAPRGNQSQSRWTFAQNQPGRQGLTINTAPAVSRSAASSQASSATRALLSPTGPGTTSAGAGTGTDTGIGAGTGIGLRGDVRQEPSRQSSASSVSSSSLFSPTGSAPQLHSSRNSPHLASTSSTIVPPGGVVSANNSRSLGRFRESQRDSAVASPTTQSPQSATSSTKQIASVVKSQVNILLTQLANLKEDKDRTKWEAQVDKIRKVRWGAEESWRAVLGQC